jgi:alpha-beta hydrolase superfamily lysophospholipase
VTCRLYGGARHEILNDACYEAVLGDIRDFLANTIF